MVDRETNPQANHPVVGLAPMVGTAPPVVAPLLLWFGGVFEAVGLAYRAGNANVFGKTREGRVDRGRFVLFFPYLVLAHASLALSRALFRFPAYHEVVPGVFLGGVPSRSDVARLRAAGVSAVLDLTAEFDRLPLCSLADYRCLPLLDATAPRLPQMQAGASWIAKKRREGKIVYVHCAKGVGRSATLVAAYLLVSEQETDAHAAVQRLRVMRTRVKLTAVQQSVLEQFARLVV